MTIDKTLIINKTDDLNAMRDKIYKNAVNHGGHENEMSIDEYCVSFHEEVSEFYREFKLPEPRALYFVDNHGFYEKMCGYSIEGYYENFIDLDTTGYQIIAAHKPLGYGIELADLVIKLLDFAGDKGINTINRDYIFYPIKNISNLVCFLHESILSIEFITKPESTVNFLRRLCLNIAEHYNFDLNEMIRIKHKYNLTLPIKN